jgi:hypothetical protein
MAQVYIPYFGNESSESLLEAYGIVTKNNVPIDTLNPKICPNCNEVTHKKGDLDVMIYKSNNIDRAVIEAIAEHINVSYDYFVEMYRQSYQIYSRR